MVTFFHPGSRSLGRKAPFLGLLSGLVGSVLLLSGCQPIGSQESAEVNHQTVLPTNRYETTIRRPVGPPRINSGSFDAHGQPITIACSTCHVPNMHDKGYTLGQPLNNFHQHIQGAHAQLSCSSCHDAASGFEKLRKADGRTLPYSDVMTLCAQCLGTQYRDYQHGAHGGMSGYWDLSRGSRQRNNCIDCHHPHRPAYPVVVPAPAPYERTKNEGQHE